jgi:hypothetical protein
MAWRAERFAACLYRNAQEDALQRIHATLHTMLNKWEHKLTPFLESVRSDCKEASKKIVKFTKDLNVINETIGKIVNGMQNIQIKNNMISIDVISFLQTSTLELNTCKDEIDEIITDITNMLDDEFCSVTIEPIFSFREDCTKLRTINVQLPGIITQDWFPTGYLDAGVPASGLQEPIQPTS